MPAHQQTECGVGRGTQHSAAMQPEGPLRTSCLGRSTRWARAYTRHIHGTRNGQRTAVDQMVRAPVRTRALHFRAKTNRCMARGARTARECPGIRGVTFGTELKLDKHIRARTADGAVGCQGIQLHFAEGFFVASRTITQLISDLSGDDIPDGKGETIEFAYRGVSYKIDLTKKEASEFDKSIALYLEHATTRGNARRAASRSSGGSDAKEIRSWARDHGINLPERGRIPNEIRERYHARR